jgi:hypothetical protein
MTGYIENFYKGYRNEKFYKDDGMFLIENFLKFLEQV